MSGHRHAVRVLNTPAHDAAEPGPNRRTIRAKAADCDVAGTIGREDPARRRHGGAQAGLRELAMAASRRQVAPRRTPAMHPPVRFAEDDSACLPAPASVALRSSSARPKPGRLHPQASADSRSPDSRSRCRHPAALRPGASPAGEGSPKQGPRRHGGAWAFPHYTQGGMPGDCISAACDLLAPRFAQGGFHREVNQFLVFAQQAPVVRGRFRLAGLQ